MPGKEEPENQLLLNESRSSSFLWLRTQHLAISHETKGLSQLETQEAMPHSQAHRRAEGTSYPTGAHDAFHRLFIIYYICI